MCLFVFKAMENDTYLRLGDDIFNLWSLHILKSEKLVDVISTLLIKIILILKSFILNIVILKYRTLEWNTYIYAWK